MYSLDRSVYTNDEIRHNEKYKHNHKCEMQNLKYYDSFIEQVD